MIRNESHFIGRLVGVKLPKTVDHWSGSNRSAAFCLQRLGAISIISQPNFRDCERSLIDRAVWIEQNGYFLWLICSSNVCLQQLSFFPQDGHWVVSMRWFFWWCTIHEQKRKIEGSWWKKYIICFFSWAKIWKQKCLPQFYSRETLHKALKSKYHRNSIKR